MGFRWTRTERGKRFFWERKFKVEAWLFVEIVLYEIGN